MTAKKTSNPKPTKKAVGKELRAISPSRSVARPDSFKLIDGDCCRRMSEIKGKEKVALVLGSPPYSLKGLRYPNLRLQTEGPKILKPSDWIRWMINVIDAALDLAPVAAFVVNDTYKNGAWHPAVDGLCWKAYGFGYRQERSLIWWKNAPPNRNDWFGNDWERIIVFKRDIGPVPTWNPTAIGTPPKFKAGGAFRQRNSKGERVKGSEYPTNSTTRPRDVIRATIGGGHMGHKLAHKNEAPYPESLIEPIILALTNPGDLIVDPFCGSGTTLAVAIKHGRRAIGIEARQSQLDITRERLNTL